MPAPKKEELGMQGKGCVAGGSSYMSVALEPVLKGLQDLEHLALKLAKSSLQSLGDTL